MTMKKKLLVAGLGLLLVVALAIVTVCYLSGDMGRFTPKGLSHAERRVREMAEAANANDPARVYDYLTEELRGMISREAFVENWAHERTYPYLIPFWIFYRGVELDEGGKTGTATFERAARLPGQFEVYGVVYENGGYYFDAFRKIADGSYIEIFDRLS